MSVVTVTLLSNGSKIDPTYEVVSIDSIREVNRIPYARIALLDGDAARQKFEISNTDVFKPGQEVEIQLRDEENTPSDTTIFKGVVVGHTVEANRHGSTLILELKDKAVKLTLTRKSVVYRDKSDSDAISSIISNAELSAGDVATTQPTHPELVQYYCTDWDFLLSRADIYGLLVAVNDGEISVSEIDLSGSAVATIEYGIDEIFDFEIEVDGSQQLKDVQSVGWDIKNQQLSDPADGDDLSLKQGNLNGQDVAQVLGVQTDVLSSLTSLDPAELTAWATGTLARSRLAFVQGRVTVQGRTDIALLDMIELAGIGDRFNGNALVTGIRHRVDADSWQTDLQVGLPAERFAERPTIIDSPAAGLLPAVNGLQIGIVDEYEEDPDKEFRVKVILPGLDEEEGSSAKKGAVWARLATPDAGKDRGYFFRPEPGDEVVVGFFNDDPRQAVILGAMYGSSNNPPKDVSEVSEENAKKGIITKQGATILIDDKEKSIQISDSHGNSIIMNEDGIAIKSAKDLKFEVEGAVTIKGKKTMSADFDSDVQIKGKTVDIK